MNWDGKLFLFHLLLAFEHWLRCWTLEKGKMLKKMTISEINLILMKQTVSTTLFPSSRLFHPCNCVPYILYLIKIHQMLIKLLISKQLLVPPDFLFHVLEKLRTLHARDYVSGLCHPRAIWVKCLIMLFYLTQQTSSSLNSGLIM